MVRITETKSQYYKLGRVVYLWTYLIYAYINPVVKKCSIFGNHRISGPQEVRYFLDFEFSKMT